MIATIDYIKNRFEEFNRRFFGGRLPALPFELSDSSRFLGLFVCDMKRLPDGTTENSNFRLRINTRIDMPQDALDDVIIHEMIHYFIAYHHLIDTSAHGKIFLSIMGSINDNHGRHIEVSHRNVTPEEREQAISKKPTWHVIAELEFRDGTYGVKVLPRNVPKVIKYVATVKKSREVKDVTLFLHDNPFFNKFPTSTALSCQPIDHNIFMANVQGAKKLIINGSQLIPVK